MEFGCLRDAFDNGVATEKIPGRGYRRGVNYSLTAPERERLIAAGLFPECFGPAIVTERQDGSSEYEPASAEAWQQGIDEWRERASDRSLPYRARTDTEDREYKKLVAQGFTRGQAMDALVKNASIPARETVVSAPKRAARTVRA